MTLVLVRCSIKVDQGGTVPARVRVTLIICEGRSHAVLIAMFMVPLGYPGVRSMAQALQLLFEY